MVIYDEPVRVILAEMLDAFALRSDQSFTRKQAVEWFSKNYPKVDIGTIDAHLRRFSTNSPSRIHFNVRSPEEDLLFKIDSDRFRLYTREYDPAPILRRGRKPGTQEPPDATEMYEVGRLYNRRNEIHGMLGGQQYGGISTPRDHNVVILFTGEAGVKFGYSDGLTEEGVFEYVGEGQLGDMKFTGGNKAIRDHVENGKDLLLFSSLGKSRPVRFKGKYVCASWNYSDGVDREGKSRQIIVFHLIPTDEAESLDDSHETSPGSDLAELRKHAYQAASHASQGKTRDAKSSYYKRSNAVKKYVLTRAAGICESCGNEAPFIRKNGSGYLEPHHTRRVSDGGPDHPRWVGAICPNCHCEIHRGLNGAAKNKALEDRLGDLEDH